MSCCAAPKVLLISFDCGIDFVDVLRFVGFLEAAECRFDGRFLVGGYLVAGVR